MLAIPAERLLVSGAGERTDVAALAHLAGLDYTTIDPDAPFPPDDRSIDVHISNLRKKLGRTADGSDRIRAIRGIGYIFVVPVKSKSR